MMKKLLPVLLLLVVMGLQIQSVSCPRVSSDAAQTASRDSTHSHSDSKPPPVDLPPPGRNCTCEYEIFCTPRTELSAPVPWTAFILSSIVSLAPFDRVRKLGPHVQGDRHTMFWYFLMMNFAAYIFWGNYTISCNFLAGDPIQLASFFGVVISSVLLHKAYFKLPKVDLRQYTTLFTIVMIGLTIAALRGNQDLFGWVCLGVTIISHFFRIGATDYTKFNGIQFFISIIGTVAGFLWLVHPDLCVAKHYKIASYVVSCFRGLETFLWCAPKVSEWLADMESRSRVD